MVVVAAKMLRRPVIVVVIVKGHNFNHCTALLALGKIASGEVIFHSNWSCPKQQLPSLESHCTGLKFPNCELTMIKDRILSIDN